MGYAETRPYFGFMEVSFPNAPYFTWHRSLLHRPSQPITHVYAPY